MTLVYSFGAPPQNDRLIDAGLASLSLSPLAASVSQFFGISATLGSLELAGFQADVSSQGSDLDWLARSTAAGVIVANRLEDQATIDDWFFDDSTGDHISLDTALKPDGAAGSLKHAILNTDSAGSGQFSVPFGRTFGNGDTVWFSYRVYFQPDEAYAAWGGAKISILSRDANGENPIGSNQINEFVFQFNYNGGRISAYHRDSGGGFPPIQVGVNTPCSGVDFIDTPELDNGVSNPLTGVHPDTGAAWSACDQYVAQFGSLHYSRRSSPGADNYRPGLGDPFDGGFRAYPGEWITITACVVIGEFGSANNRLIGMAAREGQPYKLLFDQSDVDLGAGPDYNALNLLPYVGGRVPGGRKVSARSGELSSCFVIYNVSPSMPTGSATLSYNASTGRFSLQANGESEGTPRGFSEANGFLEINVTSEEATSFINGRVIPANLPSSGITSETITIADGRPDTQRNYADVIISTQPINAPGGYAPPVVPGSVLAQAAASMSSGTWLKVTPTPDNTAELAQTGSAAGNILVYTNNGAWNPVSRRMEFVGQYHGANAMKHVQYDEATHAFIEASSNIGTGAGHGYAHIAVNPTTGDLLFKDYDLGAPCDVFGKPFGGEWDLSYLSCPNYQTNAGAALWFGGSMSGVGEQGALLMCDMQFGGISGWDPLAGNVDPDDDWFFEDLPDFSVPGGTYHGVGAYSAVHNAALFGGGNSPYQHQSWKIAADRTVTRMNDSPTDALMGIYAGVLTCDPVSGNFLLLSEGKFFELDPTGDDGKGTWTELTGDRAPPEDLYVPSDTSGSGTSPNAAIVAVELPDHGVTAWINTNGTASSVELWLYKH